MTTKWSNDWVERSGSTFRDTVWMYLVSQRMVALKGDRRTCAAWGLLSYVLGAWLREHS